MTFNSKRQAGSKWVLTLIMLAVFLHACSKKPVNLSWEDTSNNEDGFRIYRVTAEGKTKIAEVGANVTTYTDKSPLPKACYVVTAFNSAGESAPSNVSCLGDSPAQANVSR